MTQSPANALVWGEIPVRDLDRASAFYADVLGFDLTRENTGPNPMAMFAVADMKDGVAGHLYPGEPSTEGKGPTLHFEVAGRLEDAAERCWKAGGKVVSEPIAIPAGRFQYAVDPDGNSIGLFEYAKG